MSRRSLQKQHIGRLVFSKLEMLALIKLMKNIKKKQEIGYKQSYKVLAMY